MKKSIGVCVVAVVLAAACGGWDQTGVPAPWEPAGGAACAGGSGGAPGGSDASGGDLGGATGGVGGGPQCGPCTEEVNGSCEPAPVGAVAEECGPYACNGQPGCPTYCSGDETCVPGYACTGSMCEPVP